MWMKKIGSSENFQAQLSLFSYYKHSNLSHNRCSCTVLWIKWFSNNTRIPYCSVSCAVISHVTYHHMLSRNRHTTFIHIYMIKNLFSSLAIETNLWLLLHFTYKECQTLNILLWICPQIMYTETGEFTITDILKIIHTV
jgi:hypothetical protein